METSLRTGFAQIFSRCPKNLSCPKFGGAAAPLAPPARTPMNEFPVDNQSRLRVVPHFSSGIVERAKRERTWKSPHARKGDTRRGERKMGFVCSPSIFSLPAACRLFSRGVIFTPARVSLTLLSLRKNGGLLVVYNQSGINKPIRKPMNAWQLNSRDSTLNQNRTLNSELWSATVPKRAHFKDWRSNLINDTDDIHVEKLLQKVIEFENMSTQIRILYLDL